MCPLKENYICAYNLVLLNTIFKTLTFKAITDIAEIIAKISVLL